LANNIEIAIKDPRVIVAQEWLNTLITDGADSQTWRDLRAVTSLLLRFTTKENLGALLGEVPDNLLDAVDTREGEMQDHKRMRRRGPNTYRTGPRDRTFGATPRATALVAAYSPLLRAIHQHEPLGERALATLRKSAYDSTGAVLHDLLDERQASEDLIHRAERLSPKNKIFTTRPARKTATATARVHPQHIPRLWWPTTYTAVEDLFKETGNTSDYARGYLSLAAVRLLLHCTWIEAAEVLTWPDPRTGRSVSANVLSRLGAAGHVDTVNEHVHDVVDRIAARRPNHRIDFRARTAELTAVDEFDEGEWDTLMADNGIDLPATRAVLRGMGPWLWTHAGLNREHEYPGYVRRGKRSTAVEYQRRWVRDVLPAVQPAITGWATSHYPTRDP
jgi:hypothetical protein